MTTLGELASVIRSKNAGPFWLTIDVFFDDTERFERAIASGLSSRSTLAALYDVDDDAIALFVLPELRAVKISLPRPRAQGSFGDTDTHAGQQFVPLRSLIVD